MLAKTTTSNLRPGAELEQLAQEYNKSGHSVFGPSASAMWMYCAGSLIANLGLTDNGSYEAAEGTVAHDVAEEWLKTGKRPTHRVGKIEKVTNGEVTYEVLVTNVMLDYCQEYVDWCKFEPGTHYTEVKVYFSEFMPIPNQGGTSDHAACQPGKLVITDLKYGKGVKVFAEGNSQGLLYALGFFLRYDWIYEFEEIEIRIAQPRLDHFDTWTISREFLLEFAEEARARAAAAWQIGAPRKPSAKACQWCKVKTRCTAVLRLIDAVLEGRSSEFDREFSQEELAAFVESIESGAYKLRPVNVADLTDDHLAKLLPYRQLVEKWFSSVFFELESRKLNGNDVKGYKIVESRSSREFRDPVKAEQTLEMIGLDRGEIFTEKMISPNQAEILIREKFGVPRKEIPGLIMSEVLKKPGRPTLVEDRDKRPALENLADQLWDDDPFSDDDYDDEL